MLQRFVNITTECTVSRQIKESDCKSPGCSLIDSLILELYSPGTITLKKCKKVVVGRVHSYSAKFKINKIWKLSRERAHR